MTSQSFASQWIYGLPASLLLPEGKTVAVIALMQRTAGLNRERRKALEGRFGVRGEAPAWASELSRTDWGVLSHYLSGKFRFYNFWYVAESLKAYQGKERYAHAVELQLLAAYDDAWAVQTLDEGTLIAACPHWPAIREGIVSMPNIRAGGLPLAVFMLWLPLSHDLDRFDLLDPDRQRTVAHAVFALSTIGRTGWFIDEALRRCPVLSKELGLAARRVPSAAMDKTTVTTVADAPVAPVVPRIDDENTDAFGLHVAALIRVAGELRDHPTRHAVDELRTLVAAIDQLAGVLPPRALPHADALAAHRAALMAFLQELAADAHYDWLFEDLRVQVDARWTVAAQEADDTALHAIAEDAAAGLERTRQAAVAYTAACHDVAEAAAEAARLEAALASAGTFAQRKAAQAGRNEARQRLVDAEARQDELQGLLLDAASPFSAVFDVDTDYRASLAGTPGDADAQAMVLTVGRILDSGVTLDGGGVPETGVPEEEKTVASGGDGIASPAVDATPAPAAVASHVAPDDAGMGQGPPAMRDASPAPLGDPAVAASVGDDQPVVPEDVSASALVWDCLGQDEPGLAWQAARWIASARPGSRVPPAALLAATALAEELMVADGPIDTSLRSCLEQLETDDFANARPAPWHAGINLLLAAATLRPMILAPNSVAAAVAAYLHHDGHYPALYDLVQRLRNLSAKLVGFHIDPPVLRRASGEAASRTELEALQRTARDWLGTQAPAYTIRFKPATDVWKHWLKPDGLIEAVVSPVIHNRIADAQKVRDAVRELSDEATVLRMVQETDRRTLRRRKDDNIHASALDHLVRLVDEALAIPRQWLALIDLIGGGGHLRTLLEDVNKAIRATRVDVERELTQVPVDDCLGMVAVSQKQALKALYGLAALFEDAGGLRDAEAPPAEVLNRACLLIPDIGITEAFAIDTVEEEALAALEAAGGVLDPADAQRRRVERGDMLGAELLVASGLVDDDLLPLRQERERWKTVLRRDIELCREAVDIGSAYGYLQEAERTGIETHLARYESGIDDERRFDRAIAHIDAMRRQVADRRTDQKRAVELALRELLVTPEMEPTVKDAKRALEGGDITTANELLYWLRQGKAAPTDVDDAPHEGFDGFFPDAMKAIERWLDGTRPAAVPQHILDGTGIPVASDERVDGAQRKRLAATFRHWLDLKAAGAVDGPRLEEILKALGFDVRGLVLSGKGVGREVWALDAAPVGRQVCAIPAFGSAAAGRFQVICAFGRPSEDELLQWVGDATVSRPIVLLFFGRMTERRYRDLACMSKTKGRSFLFLDETLLVYLAGVSGSRLRAWFDAALPFSYSFPYDPTAGLVPPELFYGRTRELEAVTTPDGRCFIYGGRQLGKTALLKRAEQSFHNPENGHYARWIDLRAEGIGGSVVTGELWATIHERFRDMGIIDGKVPAPMPGKKHGAERISRAIREFLEADPDRRILLLLDEADRFFEQDGRFDFVETRRLKQLMDETKRRFKVVFAGLHNVLRMTERANHPLAHFGTPIEIGPLKGEADVKDAADLIRRPMEAAGFRFESNDLVLRILAQTNYYPSLIQLYCLHLLRHMIEKVTAPRSMRTGPRYTVTDRDIEQVYASDVLRDEIRTKFRLTLQLDQRYEVLAYGMALALLRSEYSQADGIHWQRIRETCAFRWWPEGFQDTSESDFRVLLDEMRGLGVLGTAGESRYVLRSANVLLLLGTQDEIEMVLNKEREPAGDFESSSFRPPMRAPASKTSRSVLTYQQLSQLLQRKNSVTVITGTVAAGIDLVVAHLRDYLGNGDMPLVIADCTDRATFNSRLQAILAERAREQTVVVVPDSVPWTDMWLKDAQSRINHLRSDNRLVSLIFIAEPATLWRLVKDAGSDASDLARMSLLPWNDGFLRHWLDEECQLPLDPDERKHLAAITGLWPALIAERVGEHPTPRALRDRLSATPPWFGDDLSANTWQAAFGLDVGDPARTVRSLAQWNEPMSEDDIAELGELVVDDVRLALSWAELLGLARRDGAGYWTIDPVVPVISGRMVG